MKKIVFLLLSFFIMGTSATKAEIPSMEKNESMTITAATNWNFPGNLIVETESHTLFEGASTITATPKGNTIDLTIKGITILIFPINLTLPNLPYVDNKISQGTTAQAMGYTVTFDEDCKIKEGSCEGVFLTIDDTPSGTVYVTFQ